MMMPLILFYYFYPLMKKLVYIKNALFLHPPLSPTSLHTMSTSTTNIALIQDELPVNSSNVLNYGHHSEFSNTTPSTLANVPSSTDLSSDGWSSCAYFPRLMSQSDISFTDQLTSTPYPGRVGTVTFCEAPSQIHRPTNMTPHQVSADVSIGGHTSNTFWWESEYISNNSIVVANIPPNVSFELNIIKTSQNITELTNQTTSMDTVYMLPANADYYQLYFNNGVMSAGEGVASNNYFTPSDSPLYPIQELDMPIPMITITEPIELTNVLFTSVDTISLMF